MERLIKDTIRHNLAEELMFGQLEFGGEVEIDAVANTEGVVEVKHNVTVSGNTPIAPVKKNRARARR
jgi:predicted xylose isomerase-like sugar epimerase